jgi:hypothetical protein
MRSRASHPGPHLTWVRALCLSHRGSGAVTASASAPKSAMLKTSAGPCSCDHDQHGCGVGQRPSCFAKQEMGEEAATPGQPVRALAPSGSLPLRQFAFENHRLPLVCRNHPASSRTLTFRWTHCRPLRPGWQYKKLCPLWRICGR